MRRGCANAAVALVIVLIACVVLSACGSSANSASSSTASTSTTRARSGLVAKAAHEQAVLRCLAKRGIGVHQPASDGGGAIPKGMTGTQFEQAFKSCGENVANIVGSRAARGIVP
jgi:pectin methylesterase-like acyl-CoA thioesterase